MPDMEVRLKIFCLLSLGLAAPLAARGQEQSRDSVIALEEVVLRTESETVSTLGLTPAQIVTGQAIRRQNPVDFATTLNQVPGVYFLSGALNTNRITIRGVGARTPFGTDKLRMYYNDIPVTNGTGFSTLEAYDLDNLASIQVVKGPKSSAYGAALGGALILQTDGAPRMGTRLATRTAAGSYGMFKSNLELTHADSTFSAQVRYNRLTSQGYRENNAFDRDGLLVDLSFRAGERHQIGLLANYIDYRAEIPSSLSRTAFEEDPTQAAFTWAAAKGYEANKHTLLGLSDRIALSDGFRNRTSLFYTYLDHYEPRPFNILDEFTLGFGFRSVFDLEFQLGDQAFSAEWGGEWYRDQYNWNTYENLYESNGGEGSLQGDLLSRNREFRSQASFFASLTVPLGERFRLRGGLALNRTSYDFRDLQGSGTENRSARREFDPILLPNLDLRYLLGRGSYIYANLSRGFNNPSLEESLSPDGLVNPEIGQEKGMNTELGGHAALLEGRLRLTAALYRIAIRDLLVADRVGEDEYIGRNAGKTRHTGLEASLEYRMGLGSRAALSPFISYTLNDHYLRDFVEGDDGYSGKRLTGVPRHRIYSGFSLRGDGGWFLSASYQYVDGIPLTDANTLESDAYNLVNAQAGYRFSLGPDLQAGLEAGVNNLFDTLYASSVLINATGFGGAQPRYFYPGNDRNYYAGFSLRYTP